MGLNVLKTAFTAIVGTLCATLLLLTVMVIFKNFPLETYKGILEVLGIPTLFGMIVQSFIHQKPEDIPNASQISVVKSSTVTTSDAVVDVPSKSGQPAGDTDGQPIGGDATK